MNWIAQMNSYMTFLKLLKITGHLIVVTQRQGNIKEIIQAPTNNAKRKLACKERSRMGNEIF
tara:strand:- start:336 stop:521 length:186 start_codon:yes stop_codon:yes gene_type:complete